MLSELLGSVGVEVRIEAPFYCDYGTQITLGDAVFVNMNCVFLDPGPIVIGAQAQLGPGVQLLTATHPLTAAARTAGRELARPIIIGPRAWLGGGVIVGAGRHDRSRYGRRRRGAWSCATCPVGWWPVGNPCRMVRPRTATSPNRASALLIVAHAVEVGDGTSPHYRNQLGHRVGHRAGLRQRRPQVYATMRNPTRALESGTAPRQKHSRSPLPRWMSIPTSRSR